jgi:hypothetical protein
MVYSLPTANLDLPTWSLTLSLQVGSLAINLGRRQRGKSSVGLVGLPSRGSALFAC